MSSGATINFTNAFVMSPTETPGNFKVSSKFTGNYTVTDATSSAEDSTVVLGDIGNDSFTTSAGSFSNTLNYYGKSADGTGVIGKSVERNKEGAYNYYLYSNNAYGGSGTYISNASQSAFALCFEAGTRIRTARGDVAVEHLQVGDLAVTASGDLRPIRWTGHRCLAGHGKALSADHSPVRVRAGAFAPGLPGRDLRLSPGHPVLVGADTDGRGGALVPVMCLINGTTVIREAVEAVTYWHVELDSHDILLAEGLPAESYLDFGCRAFFAEASDHALHNPDFVVPGLAARCRPVAVDGPLVEAARAALDAAFAAELAGQCAWEGAHAASSAIA